VTSLRPDAPLAPSVTSPAGAVIFTVSVGRTSVIVSAVALSVAVTPPPRPTSLLSESRTPEVVTMVPMPMSTVSDSRGTVSVEAVRVSVTEVTVWPVLGPVKVTVGALAVFRLLQVTPVGKVIGHARVKSVLRTAAPVPLLNVSGTASDSPFTSPRPRVIV